MKYLSLIATLALVSCAQTDWKSIQAEADKIQAGCREQRLRGALPDRAASVRCATPHILSLYQRADYPYMDLLSFQRAQQLVIAERQDRGEITEAQAEAARMELNLRLYSEVEQRNQRRAANSPVICQPVGATIMCF